MQKSSMNHVSELTDPSYWDSFWSTSTIPKLRDNDSQFGSRGYFLKAFKRVLWPLSSKSVVEFGGAMSYRLITLAKFGQMRATAIDYAPEAVERSRTFYAAHGVDIELACADFFSPEFDDRKYDVVCHWGVLEHFADPASVLKRSVALCADGGRVIFGMPQMRGPGAFLWKRLSPDGWARHVYHSDRKIEQSFNSLGWKCRRFFFGSPLFYMNPCESTGTVPSLLFFGQRIVDRLGSFVPYQYGLPYISANRGFVAWKPMITKGGIK
jgi:2-polyprenyl-3-methyl-5-hydroxy-6-metoxy-1,4-benzoquinol methylase